MHETGTGRNEAWHWPLGQMATFEEISWERGRQTPPRRMMSVVLHSCCGRSYTG